jgi:hypothetical protein
MKTGTNTSPETGDRPGRGCRCHGVPGRKGGLCRDEDMFAWQPGTLTGRSR